MKEALPNASVLNCTDPSVKLSNWPQSVDSSFVLYQLGLFT